MRRVVLGLAVAALAVPVTNAQAAEECQGVIECQTPIGLVLDVVESESEDVKECVRNGIGAIRNLLQGTPQPGVCNL